MKKITLFTATILASALAKAQVIALANSRFAIKLTHGRVAGDGTGTCLANRTAGDGTGTCLTDPKLLTFDHPKLLTSQQIVTLLNQASQDKEKEEILEMLRENDTNE